MAFTHKPWNLGSTVHHVGSLQHVRAHRRTVGSEIHAQRMTKMKSPGSRLGVRYLYGDHRPRETRDAEYDSNWLVEPFNLTDDIACPCAAAVRSFPDLFRSSPTWSWVRGGRIEETAPD
ncbi:hypothetical protein Nepgr_024070 [Nepenthes gracilis]|uniref:Uncharacterized protein n=1 Tax=Nepenthes gracilis TaxID=150966 RepID=A0AAD3XY99_NEPGR|nr:hypothetical protein Nepgr_024070 [Nepenthes gracilis]